MQSDVALNKRDELLRALMNSVAGDDQQEPAQRQITGYRVDKSRLIQSRRGCADQIDQFDVAPLQRRPGRVLEVLVAEGGKILRVVQHLAHHLAASLGVAPEFGLHDDDPALRREHDVVDVA